MSYKLYIPLCFCIALTFFSACKKDTIVTGWKPIYISTDSLYDIKNLPPQPIQNSGSIYSWGNYLFLNEQGKGIHVIDQTNPTNAINISFIKIWGNKNFSIYDSTLFADNGRDLITIDIHDVLHVSVLNIAYNAIENENYFPTESGYFECADNSKGIIVSWEQTKLINPKCKK